MIRSIAIDRISIEGIPGINRSRVEIALRAALSELAAPHDKSRPIRTAEERLAQQIADQVREAIRES